MRVVGVIQSRLGSTRLPGKALLEVHGAPMLWHVYDRTRRAKTLDEVVVATSFTEPDLKLVYWCQSAGIPVYRGGTGEDDVLGRIYDTAVNTQADIVVRICGDCPLIDPAEIGRVVKLLRKERLDYVDNVTPPTLPDGLDAQAMTMAALTAAHQEATLASEREHLTPWLQRECQRRGAVGSEQGDYGHLRFCVDEERDLHFVRAVYEAMGRDDFGWWEVVKLLEERPEIAALMGTAERNAGMKRDVAEDSQHE